MDNFNSLWDSLEGAKYSTDSEQEPLGCGKVVEVGGAIRLLPGNYHQSDYLECELPVHEGPCKTSVTWDEQE